MKPANMLHQMCHTVLAGTDIKALRKARDLPAQAVSSRGILETLFLSPQGLSGAFESLEAKEIALLHLLKNTDTPVGIDFFSRIYGGLDVYGTFNQRFQDCFAKVKQRLVRNGILLFAAASQYSWQNKSKMELWRFSLPVEFHPHLPPLLPESRPFDGDGNWQAGVVRDRLIKDLGRSRKKNDAEGFALNGGELQLNGKRIEAAKLIDWQQAGWKQASQGEKEADRVAPHSKSPDQAMSCILAELADGYWADTEQLAEPLRTFCGKKVNADTVCDVGWKWGLVAKRQEHGKTWYRLAPRRIDAAPPDYLSTHEDDSISVDLSRIPFEALEQIVGISAQRMGPGGRMLLLTPSFVKLGRADDQLLETAAVQWLVEHTRSFAEAYVRLNERRGKTILHENLCIARVSDLSLKVAMQKALGHSLVSLKNDFVAFPRDLLGDVQRVVKKSGHVVKEVAAK